LRGGGYAYMLPQINQYRIDMPGLLAGWVWARKPPGQDRPVLNTFSICGRLPAHQSMAPSETTLIVFQLGARGGDGIIGDSRWYNRSFSGVMSSLFVLALSGAVRALEKSPPGPADPVWNLLLMLTLRILPR
jgi:hypothetical protein